MKYIPASSFAVLNLTGKKDRRLYSEYKASPNWWEPNSFFKHPNMLITAFYGMNEPEFRDNYSLPRDGFELMGDSGGFQQYKGDRGLEPLPILRWQEHNCDIGFSLDFPLLSSDDLRLVRAKNKINVKHILDMLPKRENYDMDYFACVHGWTDDQVKAVHAQLPHDQIDGWGIGECSATDDSPIGIISHIALESTLNVDKKRMHILGCCSPIMIAFFALLEKKEGITISYDSTAYSNGAMYRWYHIDGEKRDKYRITGNFEKMGENHRSLNGEVVEVPAGEISELTCQCPVCKNAKIEDMLGSDSEAGTLISLHNMYKEVELNDKFQKLAQKDELLPYIQQRYSTNTKNRMIIKAIEDFYRMDTQDFIELPQYRYRNKHFISHVGCSLDAWTGEEKPVQILKAKKQFKEEKKKRKPKQPKEKKVKQKKEKATKEEDIDLDLRNDWTV